MRNWVGFGFCCLFAVISSVRGQTGCQIQGANGPVTCATCDSPTNPTNCVTCFGGFQLDNTKNPVECVACATHCLTCTTTADACVQCDVGYGPDPANTGACGACSTQAEHCEGICDKNGPGKCDICVETYGVGTALMCEPCPEHCKSCGLTSTSVCDVCVDGYSLSQGQCVVSASPTPTGSGSGSSSSGEGGGGSSTPGGSGASTPGGSGASTPGGGGSGGPGGPSTQPGGGTNSGGEGSTQPGNGGGGGGLSDNAKAGIIIGVLCGVLGLLFLLVTACICCRQWFNGGGRGYVQQAPQTFYEPQTNQYQQPPTGQYYPWNRHFSQDHSHGNAAHAHRARHLEFS